MTAPSRFHAPDADAAGQQLSLRGEEHHHLSRVLRLKPGDTLSLFDGKGRGFTARLLSVGRDASLVRVIEQESGSGESPLDLRLAVALSKSDKLDWVIQKGTELGVQAYHLLPARRSDLRLPADRAPQRMARWRRVALEACKQSGRFRIPEVHPPETLESFLASDLPPLRILLDPGARSAFHEGGMDPASRSLVVATGPEGGWEPDEVESFRAAGFVALRLGPRVLRCETAAMAAAALCQFLSGDLR
jgi:16S rRNA (uracil1498-N3)-methyltransferase